MKSKLKLVGIIVVLITGFCFSSNKKQVPALALENIEALANGEGGNGVNCYGDGPIDCAGIFVKMKISGLSLK